MKVLLIDAMSSFLDFALRCEAEGHEVRVFVGPLKNGDRSTIGNGLFTRVSSWEAHMKWADLIVVSDNAKYTTALEPYRVKGFPIFGPNIETTAWELNRERGQEILRSAGIPTIPSIPFKKYSDAIDFVSRNLDKRYVCKPNGDVSKALSYCSKSGQDMIFMLEHWAKEGAPKDSFIIQEFHKGIEMAVGGWFGPGGFSKYFLENFEHKKLMNDDKGPNTGEQGTVMKYVTDSLLAEECLLPLEGELYRQGYTGYIDVAVIIDGKGKVWPLEFTTRPGWPLFQIQQQLHPNTCEWMLDMVRGTDTFKPSEKVAVGVVISMPDYPYGHLTQKELSGYPVWGITDKNRKWIHPTEMMLGVAPHEDGGKIKNIPCMVSAGSNLMTVCGTGDTVEDAQERAYKVIDQLEVPNSPMYRTDIGERVKKQLPELQKLGYATEWEI